jgi:hypothetical protein
MSAEKRYGKREGANVTAAQGKYPRLSATAMLSHPSFAVSDATRAPGAVSLSFPSVCSGGALKFVSANNDRRKIGRGTKSNEVRLPRDSHWKQLGIGPTLTAISHRDRMPSGSQEIPRTSYLAVVAGAGCHGCYYSPTGTTSSWLGFWPLRARAVVCTGTPHWVLSSRDTFHIKLDLSER